MLCAAASLRAGEKCLYASAEKFRERGAADRRREFVGLNRNASRSGGVSRIADVAQEVEQLTCNQQVVGSTPTIGSSEGMRDGMYGTERCPSGQREQTVNLPAFAFGGSNPPLSMECNMIGGSSSVGRARAFQARGRGFDSRLPLLGASAHVAQAVEHFLGKEEVTGSNPVVGSWVMRRAAKGAHHA